MSIHEELRQAPLFGDFTDPGIGAITEVGQIRNVASGEALYQVHDPSETLFVVLQGEVKTYSIDGKRKVELCAHGEGDYFGELSLFGGTPLCTAAVAVDHGRVFCLSKTALRQLLRAFPEPYMLMVSRVVNELRDKSSGRMGLAHELVGIHTDSEVARLRSLSEVVAGVAHEIGTPLGIIRNAASFVADNLGHDSIVELARGHQQEVLLNDIADAFRLIEKNVELTSRLIQSFKNLSVWEVTTPRETVDVVQVIEEAVSLFRIEAQGKRLDIHVLCDLLPNHRVWSGFPGSLSQVILNLLTNIARYAYPDGNGGRAELIITQTGARSKLPSFEVVVRDFGCGIPESDISRIYEPFFTRGNAHGMGLGLTIVFNVMKSLGGSVNVWSKPGEGTAFNLRFPRNIPGGSIPSIVMKAVRKVPSSYPIKVPSSYPTKRDPHGS